MEQFNQFKSIGQLIKDKNIVLKGADALTQKGYTLIPNLLLRGRSISPLAKLIYAVMLSYAWHNDFCFPGQERLASDVGISRQSVNTYIKELEKKGFLSIRRRGQGKTNIYELNLKKLARPTKKANE